MEDDRGCVSNDKFEPSDSLHHSTGSRLWGRYDVGMAKTVDLKTRIRSGAKVRATVDLPGVPAGTQGKVAMSNGLTWLRYWVRFENGELVSHVNHDEIVISRAWDQFFLEKERAAEAAAAAAAGISSDDGGGGGSGGGDNAFGVPQYLIDRTKAALEKAGVSR